MTIYLLKDVNKDNIKEAGGKGANLGEMFNAKFPVPEAFIVGADSYKDFISCNRLAERIKESVDSVNVNDSEKLQKTANEIQKMVINGIMDEKTKKGLTDAYKNLSAGKPKNIYVSVRSSATAEDLPDASFAGQHATFLNVRGNEKLLKSVKACWASLYTARAIFYREKNRFAHEKVNMAVIVQKMVQADVAGVMFTVNPVTKDDKEIVIEACLGLGEALVSGRITPDNYVVRKSNLKVAAVNVGEQEWKYAIDSGTDETIIEKISEKGKKRKLDDKDVKEIARYGKQIEKHYKKPQDIEWAYEKGKLYILQSRPITAL